MKNPFGKSALGIVRKYHPEVTKVIDATKSLEISVTADDCKKGRSKKAGECAMAKALMREYDGAIVSLSKAYLIKGKTAIRYNVPQSVSREIVSFDRSHKFSPGEYKLSQIPPRQRLGKRPWVQPPDRGGGGERKRAHHTAGIRSL